MIMLRAELPLPAKEDVELFEKKADLSLPADYKAFLIEKNGGFTTNFYPQSVFDKDVVEVNSIFGVFRKSLDAIVRFTDYETEKQEFFDLYRRFRALQLTLDHPESVICIGASPIIDVLMSLDPEHYGRIYCGHPHEGEEQLYDEERAESTSIDEELAYVGYRPFANSFTEFMNSSVSKAEYEASFS